MRLWSLHPKYLDTKGLVAMWRETLLAKHVLEGKTKGYINHPQLIRFKNSANPLNSVNLFLEHVYIEAKKRGYNFDVNKFEKVSEVELIPVTRGQIEYEREHLIRKLKERDLNKLNELLNISSIEQHPLFIVVDGDIEEWEKV
jgi:hypothetical protein